MKRETLQRFEVDGATLALVSAAANVPIRTLRDWRADGTALMEYSGSEKNKSMGDRGERRSFLSPMTWSP
jgi:hypothetical protein